MANPVQALLVEALPVESAGRAHPTTVRTSPTATAAMIPRALFGGIWRWRALYRVHWRVHLAPQLAGPCVTCHVSKDVRSTEWSTGQ